MSVESVSPPPESQTLWYYADAANQPVGPLPMDVLQRLAGVGVISPETHVLEKGGTEWKKFASISPHPVRTESKPASIDIPPSSPAVPAKGKVADGFKPALKNRDLSKGQIIVAFVGLAIFLAYKVSTYQQGEESKPAPLAPANAAQTSPPKSERDDGSPSDEIIKKVVSGKFKRGSTMISTGGRVPQGTLLFPVRYDPGEYARVTFFFFRDEFGDWKCMMQDTGGHVEINPVR